jgi:predicted permease
VFTDEDNNDYPIITRPHIVFTDRRQRQPINTICGRIMIGLSLLSSISKHNMWSCYDSVVVVVFRQQTQYVVVLWLGCCCRPSVTTICGRIMIGLSLCSSVNTICGRIMIGLSLSSVSKHNMWSCYDWVVVVVCRLLTQYVVVLWLGCRCSRPLVNTICGRIMIGLSLSSVSKHNTTTQS